MNLFQEAIERLNIDIILLNKINLKYNTINRNKMTQRMKKLGRETKLFMSDSKEWNTIKYSYLPGGILTVMKGKVAPLIQEDEIHYGKLGNFIVVKVKQADKMIAIINLYRVPSTSPRDPCYCVT